MDWITLLVEAAGATIFIVWAVLPAREFREIYLRLKAKGREESGEETLPVVMADEGGGEEIR